MDEEKLIEMISAAVVRVLKEESQGGAPQESAGAGAEPAAEDLTVLTDLTSPEYKQKLTVPAAENDLARWRSARTLRWRRTR